MPSIKKFQALCINCSTEDDVLAIAVGDDAQEPINYFIIGRFDEDNLSVDGCIGFQTESTDYELTGVIDSILLTKKSLTVSINDDGATKAGNKEFEAVLPDNFNISELKNHISEIFTGSQTKVTLP